MASTRRSEQLLIFVTFLLATGCSVIGQDINDEEPIPPPKPFVTEPGKNIVLKEGETLLINCTISNFGDLPITWKFLSDSVDKILYLGTFKLNSVVEKEMSTFDKLHMSIENVSKNHTGNYSCYVQDATQVHSVQVEYSPTFATITPRNEVLTVISGNKIEFTCNGDGFPEPSFDWYFNDDKLPMGVKAQGRMLTIPSISEKHAGKYTCSVTNGIGKPKKKLIELVVLHKPIIGQAESKIAKKGDTIKLSCEHEANPSANISWSKMEDSHGFETNFNATILTLKNVSEKDAGTYECHLANHLGTAKKKFHLEIKSQTDDSHSTLTSQQTEELSSSSTGDNSAATNDGYSTTGENSSLARSPTLALITFSLFIVGLSIA